MQHMLVYTLRKVYNRVPTVLIKKISRTFQDPRSIFPGPCHMPVMFKHRDKQQLLTIYP